MKYRAYTVKGRIHLLGDGGCDDGKYITDCNFKDFSTYREAEQEILKLGISPQKCKKCHWENIEGGN